MNKKSIFLNRLIFVLSIVGIIIALYVTQSFLRGSPIVCVNSGCELVRKSAASYLFGFLPVPAVGLIGYSVLAILAFLRTVYPNKDKQLLNGILGIATFGVFFVAWFTYTEFFVIRGICTWCVISAMNMCIIFILALKSYLQKQHSLSFSP